MKAKWVNRLFHSNKKEETKRDEEVFVLSKEQSDFLESKNLTEEQQNKLSYGFKLGLSIEQMEVLANPELTPKQMMFLMDGFDFQLPIEVMKVLSNPKFDTFQIRILECGYRDALLLDEDFVDIDVVKSVTDPSIPSETMHRIIDENRFS